MAAVTAEHLGVTIGGSVILADINLAIPEGQITGLLGPSGSGKTTLMRTIVGLQKATAGTVTVLGQPAGAAPLRKRIGYMTQAPSVYGDLTVAENLSYFGTLIGVTKQRAQTVMADVDISGLGKRLVGTLSGGQRARVSLVVALLGQPELLVLDEPTVGLDPLLRNQLWGTFRELAASGTTLVISSHVMDEASRCNRLLLLREGRVLAADTPAALQARTKTHTVEGAFIELVGGER